jgi:hypothetical protein
MTRERSTRPATSEALVRGAVGGDGAAAAAVVEEAATSVSPAVLVTAGVLTDDPAYVRRAADCAVTPRDRQLVELARAHLAGDADRLGALVRDHLVEHPDHLLAAWIAGRPGQGENA